MECRLGAREEERESSHRHVLPLRRKDGRRDGDIAYMRSTKAGYPVRWIRISRGCKNYRSERIISSVALCGIGRNSSECLSSIPSRNRARGDTKMHSFPCVTTPPLHFQLQLKLSQSSFQSQKVGKSSGGRQENFQQKVLLFYVSTYLPIDRSAQQWKKRKGAGHLRERA